MTTTVQPQKSAPAPSAGCWLTQADSNLDDFITLVEQTTVLDDYPFAEEVAGNVVIYGDHLRRCAQDPLTRRQVQTELARALTSGPGLVVFKRAFEGPVIDRASATFQTLIDTQRTRGSAGGDHFAQPGENDRVWGALDKFAVADPQGFVDYYTNDVLALVSEAWLGPHYRITSQLNVVNPGGRAQTAHRDYHLGMQNAEDYPAHVHTMSTFLTLQGAIAHVDMPVATGPTMYLPYSQRYSQGFVAVHRADFIDYFDRHYVQLPLEKGDAAFFNPGLFHGAGTNRTAEVRRMANLLQVSSGFGRAIEGVDTTTICKAVYSNLVQLKANGVGGALSNGVTAAAEGYPFPTNLDRDQPGSTLVPPSQADLLHEALDQGWDEQRFFAALDAQQQRRLPAPADAQP